MDRTSPLALVGNSPRGANLVLSWLETDLRKTESLRVLGWKGLTKWWAAMAEAILERQLSFATVFQMDSPLFNLLIYKVDKACHLFPLSKVTNGN